MAWSLSAASASAIRCGSAGRSLSEIDQLDIYAHAARDIRPTMTEAAGGGDQRPVAAGEHVANGRFPRAVAVGHVHRNMAGAERHALEVGHQRANHVDEFTLVDVGRRAMHGGKHAVGHDRGPGYGEVGAAGAEGHLRGSCAMWKPWRYLRAPSSVQRLQRRPIGTDNGCIRPKPVLAHKTMAQKKAHEVDAWLKRPDPRAQIVLIYGPDRGLVSERARAFAVATGLCPGRPLHRGAARRRVGPASGQAARGSGNGGDVRLRTIDLDERRRRPEIRRRRGEAAIGRAAAPDTYPARGGRAEEGRANSFRGRIEPRRHGSSLLFGRCARH